MPKVDVKRDLLFKELGRTYTQEEFENLCFEYGVELDDVTSEKQMVEKEKGAAAASSDVSDEVIYKIDVPANRYDLLCLEGISRALLIFLGKIKPPTFTLTNPSKRQRIIVKPETQKVRPVVVGAVLRGITFDSVNYNSFIGLQEKLHQNICRKRTLVSIGTHDLDTLQGPFTYEALPPSDITFAPLDTETAVNAVELFSNIRSNKPHLEPYLGIIESSPVYPVFYDRNRTVLSLPPIINGNHSKIVEGKTKNVLIEITATDKTKALVVLNIMIAMFAQYCSPAYSVESLEVEEADGTVNVYPDLSERIQTASVEYIKSAIGVSEIESSEIASLLNRMSLPAVLKGDEVQVRVPITRSDIMHACDVMEDVAIAYGYNNIVKKIPQTVTAGSPQPLNKVADLLRIEIANAGFLEILTFSLCSLKDNFKNLRRKNDNTAVILDSASEFQCGRITLLGGMLRSINANKAMQLPLKVFEVGDVFGKDSTTDTGSSNKRMVAGIYCNTSSSFETIHGLVDRIMLLLRIKSVKQDKDGYEIKPSQDRAFLEKRGVDIFVGGKKIGVMGVMHPKVNKRYEIPHPLTAFELELTLDLARWHDKKNNNVSNNNNKNN